MLADNDLSDNIINGNTLDLSLNDLSDNKLWDLSDKDLSDNDLSWNFFDSDFGTNKGDQLTYSATVGGESIPASNNWITFKNGKLEYAPLHANVGTHTIVITVVDLSGNTSQDTFTLTVEDTHTRSSLADKSMETGDTLEFTLPEFAAMLADNDLSDNIIKGSGSHGRWGLDLSLNDLSDNKLWDLSDNDLSDNDLSWNFFDTDFGTNKGDTVYYSAYINDDEIHDHLHGDEWATFHKGKFTFKPGHDDAGVYTIKIVTTDLSGNETTQSFTLTVTEKHIRSDLADRNVDEGGTLEFTLPEFAAMLADNDLSDNIIEKDGKWGLDLSLNDLSDNKLWDLSDNDLSDNDLSWNFFDPDFGTNKGDLSMYEVKMDGEELPATDNWATFNKGKFSFKPKGSNIGNHTIVITTTDLSGNISTQSFVLTVNAVYTPFVRSVFTANSIGMILNHTMSDTGSLVFTLPEFDTVSSNDLTSDFHSNDGIKLNSTNFLAKYDAPALDKSTWVFEHPKWSTSTTNNELYYCAEDALGNDIPRSNNWITFAKGKFTVNPANLNSGLHNITLYAYDNLNYYTSVQIRITVGDTASPVLTLLGDATITVKQGLEYVDAGATAVDGVDGAIDVVVTGSVNASVVGTYVLTYTATDAAGNVASLTRTVTVEDQDAPVITLLGAATVTVKQGTEYVDAGATATDNNDGAVDVVVTGSVDASVVGTYVLTYTATDAAGNVATVTRTVSVEDQDAPVMTLLGTSSVVVRQGTEYVEAGATAVDSNDGELTVVIDGSVKANIVGEYVLTYYAVDAAGNVASLTRTVSVIDMDAPVINLLGEQYIVIKQGSEYVDAGATATDNNDGTTDVLVSVGVNANVVGDYVVTYTATDAAGNEAIAYRYVSVVDQDAPVITLLGVANVTVNQGSEYVDAGATATDVKYGDPNLYYQYNNDPIDVVVTGSVDTSVVGSYVLTYTATDAAGNVGIAYRTVSVVDMNAPVITLVGDKYVVLNKGSEYVDAGATADDVNDGSVATVLSGYINTNLLGEYVLTYTATDAAGNTASETRIVTVVDVDAPVITLLGNANVVLKQGTEYVDAGASATDNNDVTVDVVLTGSVDNSVVGEYVLTYTATDAAGNVGIAYRTVSVVANNLPVLGNIQLIMNANELFEAVIPVHDNDCDEITLTVENLPSWLSFDAITNVLSGTPSNNDKGNYTITVFASDNRGEVVSRDYNLNVISCELESVSFNKNQLKDVTAYGNITNFVHSVTLKFIDQEAPCVGLLHTAYKTGNNGYVVDFDFSDEHKDKLVELQVITAFNPMFFKYRGNRLVKLVEMDELSTFEPNRWATVRSENDEYSTTVFQGYFRDLHMNAGCAMEEFDAGICEDPHILTLGGNRLDLPHNDHIYNMLNGLGLKINVKSQLLGEGSYAKYFYVDYQGEEFIVDIDDLDLKQSANRVKTKYHMLKSIDYSGNNFVFEKQMRTLIVRSTDGIMELVFNAETRGLLIKSRLNFTQENTTGVLMSNYADECELKELTQ